MEPMRSDTYLSSLFYDHSQNAASYNRRSIFLSDPVRPVGGVEDADGVHDARPSVLYAPTGPWGPSVASFDLKQPSMHRRSTIRRLG